MYSMSSNFKLNMQPLIRLGSDFGLIKNRDIVIPHFEVVSKVEGYLPSYSVPVFVYLSNMTVSALLSC